ncbi:MAG: IPT/TIG domain-containing protein, partial [Planctomycetota bacterium]
ADRLLSKGILPRLIRIGLNFVLSAGELSTTGFFPTAGDVTGGTEVTISGSGFTRGGDTNVLFGGLPADIVSITPETIVCIAPPAAADGGVDVVVTTQNGENSALVGQFAFGSDPGYTVSRTTGPDYGGTLIAIRGEGLTSNSSVTIGGAPLVEAEFATTEEGLPEISGFTPPGCGDAAILINDGSRLVARVFRYASPTVRANLQEVDYDRGVIQFTVGGTVRSPTAGVGDDDSFSLGFVVELDGEVLKEVYRSEDENEPGERTYEAVVPPATRVDQIGRDLDLTVRNLGAPESCKATAAGVVKYVVPVLFLGEFAWDLASDDDLKGASNFDALLRSFGLRPVILRNPSRRLFPSGQELARYPLIFFSAFLNRDGIDFEERFALQQAAESGCTTLIVLGEHAISFDEGDTIGNNSFQRDQITRQYGIEWNRDLFVELKEGRHIPYNGCDRRAFNCPPIPGDPQRGDPDNGTEWALLEAPPEQRDSSFPLFQEDGTPIQVLFNWGQTLRLFDSERRPLGEALLLGTENSYGEQQPSFFGPEDGCDGFFRNFGEPTGTAAVGAAEVTFDCGAIIAIGDQQFLSNRFFVDQCRDGTGYQHRTIVRRFLEGLVANVQNLLDQTPVIPGLDR